MPCAETSPRPVSWQACWLRTKAKTFSVESVGLPAPPHVATDPPAERAAWRWLSGRWVGGGSMRGRWSRAQRSGFCLLTHLLSSCLLGQVCFSPLCSVAAAAGTEGRLQTGTFSGNTWKCQLPGQVLGLGIFMLFCVYLRHFVSSAPLPTGPVYIRLVPQVPTVAVSNTSCSGWRRDEWGGHAYSSGSAGVPASVATHSHHTAEKPTILPCSSSVSNQLWGRFQFDRRTEGLFFFSIFLKV